MDGKERMRRHKCPQRIYYTGSSKVNYKDADQMENVLNRLVEEWD